MIPMFPLFLENILGVDAAFQGMMLFLICFPVAAVLLAAAFIIRRKSRTAIMYYNGECIVEKDMKLKDSQAVIGKTLHTFDGVSPVPYKSLIPVKQLCYFVDSRKIKAVDMQKILNSGEMSYDRIPPDTMKTITDGADIKNMHKALQSMGFSWNNPYLWAGAGAGIAVGILIMIMFYHPTAAVQVVSAEAAKETVATITPAFLVFP